MEGIRLIPSPDEENFLFRIARTPGAYGSPDGKEWFCTTPNGLFGSLHDYKIVQHEDSTISVIPSIVISQNHDLRGPVWHGFLTRGIWSDY